MSVKKNLKYELDRMNENMDEQLFRDRMYKYDLIKISSHSMPMREDEHIWCSCNDDTHRRRMIYGKVKEIECFNNASIPCRIHFQNPHSNMQWSIKPMKHNHEKQYVFYRPMY